MGLDDELYDELIEDLDDDLDDSDISAVDSEIKDKIVQEVQKQYGKAMADCIYAVFFYDGKSIEEARNLLLDTTKMLTRAEREIKAKV